MNGGVILDGALQAGVRGLSRRARSRPLKKGGRPSAGKWPGPLAGALSAGSHLGAGGYQPGMLQQGPGGLSPDISFGLIPPIT